MLEKSRNSEKLTDMPDQEAMNFYNGRYFVVNQNLLKFLGLWPYQNKMEKIFIRIVITFILTISLAPHVTAAIQMKKNMPRLMQAVGTVVYILGIAAKFFGMVFTESKLKFLYENMVQNWNMLENEIEKQILQKSSEMGRLLTIGYVGYMMPAGIAFTALPIGYNMFNRIWPSANESLPRMFLLEGEYLIDREQYYYYIYLFEVFTVLATVPLIYTVDSAYAVCIQQCVGLFDVVKLRLELATELNDNGKSINYPANDAAYEAIAKSAELHERVLKFALVLESSFSSSLLAVMIVNVLVLAAAAVAVLIFLDNPVLLLRMTLLNIGFTIHMFYLSWPGQKMIDGSNAVFYAAYNNKWYNCSIECQKLLIFIMQRTMEPFYLTAGGFYIMNFENFIVLFKSALSYVTVLSSFTL